MQHLCRCPAGCRSSVPCRAALPAARRRRRPSTSQPMVLRGCRRMRKIMGDVRIGEVELILRVEAVAFFGDRQRHDACIARGETRECRVGVRRAHQQLANGADDARARRGTEFHQRVQTLLRP